MLDKLQYTLNGNVEGWNVIFLFFYIISNSRLPTKSHENLKHEMAYSNEFVQYHVYVLVRFVFVHVMLGLGVALGVGFQYCFVICIFDLIIKVLIRFTTYKFFQASDPSSSTLYK